MPHIPLIPAAPPAAPPAAGAPHCLMILLLLLPAQLVIALEKNSTGLRVEYAVR